jgi:hypothetical protein
MLVVLAFTAAAISGIESRSPKASRASTVCDLIRDHSKFASKSVSVYGQVRGGVDGLSLSDTSCPGPPVAIVISNAVANRPDAAPLWRAIYRDGYIGTVGKDIRARITGTYSYSPGRWPRGSIAVDTVSDFSYAKK